MKKYKSTIFRIFPLLFMLIIACQPQVMTNQPHIPAGNSSLTPQKQQAGDFHIQATPVTNTTLITQPFWNYSDMPYRLIYDANGNALYSNDFNPFPTVRASITKKDGDQVLLNVVANVTPAQFYVCETLSLYLDGNASSPVVIVTGRDASPLNITNLIPTGTHTLYFQFGLLANDTIPDTTCPELGRAQMYHYLYMIHHTTVEPSPSPSPSVSPSASPSVSPSPTVMPSPTPTPTINPTPTPTPSPSSTPTATPSPTPSPTPTATVSPSPTATPSSTPSADFFDCNSEVAHLVNFDGIVGLEGDNCGVQENGFSTQSVTFAGAVNAKVPAPRYDIVVAADGVTPTVVPIRYHYFSNDPLRPASVQVKVVIRNQAKVIVKEFGPFTVNNGVPLASSYVWDGKGNNGSVVPKGIYSGEFDRNTFKAAQLHVSYLYGNNAMRTGGLFTGRLAKNSVHGWTEYNSELTGGINAAKNFFFHRVGHFPAEPLETFDTLTQRFTFRTYSSPKSGNVVTVDVYDFVQETLEKIRFP